MARNVLQLFPDMFQVGARELGTALEVPESAPGLPPSVAVHAETMLNRSPSAHITADEHSAHLPQLRRIPAHGGRRRLR